MRIENRLIQVHAQAYHWPSIAMASLLLGAMPLLTNLAQADKAAPRVPPAAAEPADAERWVTEPLNLEIPPAPEPFASWIDQGDVSFDFYDPQREPFAFAGETRFKFHYSYRCQTHWRLLGDSSSDSAGTAKSGTRRRGARPDGPPAQEKPTSIEVRLVYDEVNLSVSHRIRLPKRLADPALFDHPLVRHEFDHVAISGDLRLRNRLERMLTQRNVVITEPLEEGQWLVGADQQDEPENQGSDHGDRPAWDGRSPVSKNAALDQGSDEQQQRRRYAAIARAAVRRQSDRVFEEFVEAVAIRHRELDRVTSHGTGTLSGDERARLIDSPRAE